MKEITKPKSLRVLEWQAVDLRKRIRTCEKEIVQRRLDESSLLSRLRTASIRVRSDKETRTLVHGEQIRVRASNWDESKQELHEAFHKECERVGVYVSMLEVLLDIKPAKKKRASKKKGDVWRKRGLKRDSTKDTSAEKDPVVEEAKDDILSFLEANGGKWRKAEILEALDLKKHLFQHAVKSLGGDGKIKKEGSRRMMTYEAVK
tara:strand:- start:245 stop:859 length:615 start_codon:yes stop_codon:yes gene_type:complete